MCCHTGVHIKWPLPISVSLLHDHEYLSYCQNQWSRFVHTLNNVSKGSAQPKEKTPVIMALEEARWLASWTSDLEVGGSSLVTAVVLFP